jgi:hypothetical protein
MIARVRLNEPQPMKDGNDDDVEMMADEFWDEHERAPRSSEELVRWWARKEAARWKHAPTISLDQLEAWGWEIRGDKIVNAKTGKPINTVKRADAKKR